MTLPYYGRQPLLVSVVGLLDAVREGSLRIARFQRRFTWTDQQRVDLLDSIYQGYPIGTLTVWRTRTNRLACEKLVGDLAVPGDEHFPSGAVMEYVLDGLQRVSTLYGALGPALVDSSGDPAERARWEIYFDLDTKKFASATDRLGATSDVRERQLPLSLVLDTRQLLNELDRHRSAPDRIAVAQDLVRKINAYQVPILPLITEALEDAVESFQRLNTAGTKLDESAILHAASYVAPGDDGPPAVDLLRGFDMVRSRVGGVWENIEALDDATLGHLTRVELGLPIYSDKGKVARFVDAIRRRPQVLDDVAEGVERATEFLAASCGVLGPNALPYMFQLVLLAFVLRRRWPLSEQQSTAAARWFWSTTWTHHFASQRRIQGALRDLERLLDGVIAQPNLDDRNVARAARFVFGRARDKALALKLAELGPRLTSDGQLDAVAEARGLLADLGAAAVRPLIPERLGETRLAPALVRSAGNMVIVRESQLSRLRSALLDEPLLWTDAVFASHAIDGVAAERLRERDYEGFIRARLTCMRAMEWSATTDLGLEYIAAAADDTP